MTRLESLGALAAMIFIAALIVGTAFPASLRALSVGLLFSALFAAALAQIGTR
jgi:hypothetical protein